MRNRITNLEIIEILLSCRTTGQYILFGNNDYPAYGKATDCIPVETILKGAFIPRVLKAKELQKERTKKKAEVFTPVWVVQKQNDSLEENFREDSLQDYVKQTWLEITCGEAPYISTRYNTVTGENIPVIERVGFLDRKLQRVNKEVSELSVYIKLVKEAYKASYGFEWAGDSLYLARENMLLTFIEFYKEKWGIEPERTVVNTHGDNCVFCDEILEQGKFLIFHYPGLEYNTAQLKMRACKRCSGLGNIRKRRRLIQQEIDNYYIQKFYEQVNRK